MALIMPPLTRPRIPVAEVVVVRESLALPQLTMGVCAIFSPPYYTWLSVNHGIGPSRSGDSEIRLPLPAFVCWFELGDVHGPTNPKQPIFWLVVMLAISGVVQQCGEGG